MTGASAQAHRRLTRAKTAHRDLVLSVHDLQQVS